MRLSREKALDLLYQIAAQLTMIGAANFTQAERNIAKKLHSNKIIAYDEGKDCYTFTDAKG